MASNRLKRIFLSNPTHIMSVIDLMVINVKAPRIDGSFSSKKEFSKLILIMHE